MPSKNTSRNFEPLPDEPDMCVRVAAVRTMVEQMPDNLDEEEQAEYVAGWLNGHWREGWRVGNRAPRRSALAGCVDETLTLQLGEQYRLFTNPERTSGALCVRDGCDGHMTTDSLTDAIAWIQAHQTLSHPTDDPHVCDDPAGCCTQVPL